ncbi:hypothetical protein MnTg02_00398 [bacterium MnTg02]|nr:hypothetical protein MnTg02_00398 [bacterium MnTg02]
MKDLRNPIFHDEKKARLHLEKLLWPGGPVCPHCGSLDGLAKVTKKRKLNKTKTDEGKKPHPQRPGLYYCNNCKGQFTVTVGTVFEKSKVPLTKWLLGFHLMASSKKGISAHQLHRNLKVTYKTAWFMAHRIRECMKPGSGKLPLGGPGKTIEADETYFGKRENPRPSAQRKGRPYIYRGKSAEKRPIVSLVERGGNVRTFHVQQATKDVVKDILFRNVSRKSILYTDESRLYTATGKQFADHGTVRHSADEYVRGDIHTNTVEGFFSIFKRGMKGVYQHCGEAHLHRYLAEFDFRYNHRIALGYDDTKRAEYALRGAAGKRLTYRRTNEAPNA